MDIRSDEKDMTGDRESNQEATLPGAGDSGAGNSGAGDPGPGDPGPGDPGPAAPGTRLLGTDGATVEDLIRQLEKDKLMRRRAERALVKQKRINLALRKRNNSVNKKSKRKSHTCSIHRLS